MKFPIHRITQTETQGVHLSDEFWRIIEPPSELYVQGSDSALQLLERLPEYGLAVVGTRGPQPRSLNLVAQMIRDLAGSQLIILSGLARGIDTAAHHAALRASIPTIAILGAGLDLNYPAENSELRQNILKANGLVISEFPTGSPAARYHFLRRNRLIAGWSKATCVVEAGYRSGALNTARWARDQNRTCLAVSCFPGDPSLAGNQVLLDRDHALAYWGVHSLGAVWFDLATHLQRRKQISIPPSSAPQSPVTEADLADLVVFLTSMTFQKGGLHVQELLNWALSRRWSPEKFFSVLRSAMDSGRIANQNGIFLALR